MLRRRFPNQPRQSRSDTFFGCLSQWYRVLGRSLARVRNEVDAAADRARSISQKLSELLEDDPAAEDSPHLEETLARLDAVRDAYAAAAKIVRASLKQDTVAPG